MYWRFDTNVSMHLSRLSEKFFVFVAQKTSRPKQRPLSGLTYSTLKFMRSTGDKSSICLFLMSFNQELKWNFSCFCLQTKWMRSYLEEFVIADMDKNLFSQLIIFYWLAFPWLFSLYLLVAVTMKHFPLTEFSFFHVFVVCNFFE